MVNSSNQDNLSKENQEINLKHLFEQYIYYWKWFFVSVLLFGILALIYLRYADKIYKVDSKILLQDESKATGELSGLTEIANLTGGPASAFVMDQIDVIKSRRIFRKVVDQNRLNIVYQYKGNVKNSELTEQQSPVKLVVLDPNNSKLDSIKYSFTLSQKNGEFLFDDEINGPRKILFRSEDIFPLRTIDDFATK
ncbi:Wzz/FepE/Etk N-terminal domain-containing protein [Sphingobacterium daejeonense]|uniref:Wzz/FepE/Etk N-terminal domain-containing protein n=1 Tax=Sphingobacterium daejeonense TaxID=371142 RepID=UPI0010C3870F|nr:Wzz/FepE/Etk N-terminal domain-containing protein [Sphingobacterium daejeonense]VTQ07292.1 tyrosine kinase [Sphingobacterium daejeonense]